ncbi:N-acyl homoserine lactonase family protein [Massilia sp. TSP1-1-2]|uniref:N-acyl homoserine lactonase family protein n=1 Tax=Massilia sp. TSP1-1-2 TaxID=2804649 RepID=UPI003CE75A1F
MTLIKRALCASLMLLGSTAFAAGTADAPAAVRLYAMDCGTIAVSDISVFSPGVDAGQKKTLTDSCYVIVHPKGVLMWDTGLSDELAAMPDGKQLGKEFHGSLKKTVAAQLKEAGIAPEKVTFLGLSHMHFDHIGNVGLFPRATLLMQKEELALAFGPDAAKFGNDPKNYPTLAANPRQELTGDHDVFGDGSVVIKRAIGHTPGHQSLFVKLKKTGNVVLSGDLAHFTKNWENRRVPSFNFDKETSLKSMNEMAAFIKENKAQFWIQHDLEQNQKLKHAPKFYE